MELGTQKYIVGIYSDDDVILHAVPQVRAKGIRIHEVYSPFAIHGMDPALGYKHSRLPIAAFMFGTCGLLGAFSLITLTNGSDWPLNIGGKPHVSVTMVPVSFEGTVLIAALGMVGTFLLASGLGPGSKKTIFDPRASDDKFVMAVNVSKNKNVSVEDIKEAMRQSGAIEVYEKEVEA
jgi:hypothetical protein